MNLRTPMKFLAVTILFFSSPVFAEELLCPKSISVKQKITSLPPSWEVFAQALPYQLKAVAFFEGHPKHRAALVNDLSETIDTKTELAIWNLPRSSKGFWIECSYDQTTVALTKRLSESISQCRATYDRGISVGGMQLIRNVVCK